MRLAAVLIQPMAADDVARALASVCARYFGAALSECILIPGDDAALGEIRFVDWLGLSVSTMAQRAAPLRMRV